MNIATPAPPPTALPTPDTDVAPTLALPRSRIRDNLFNEIVFSSFSGVFIGLTLFVSQVVALKALAASPAEITLLLMSFPIGAVLGPMWAALGRRWGMQKLVVRATLLASVPLFSIFWVKSSLVFVLIVSFSCTLYGAMKMGYASMYRRIYPNVLRGRFIGILMFWTTLTMAPTMLGVGRLLDWNPSVYRVLYPIGGVCGLVACLFYSRLRPLQPDVPIRTAYSLRAGWHGLQKALFEDHAFLYFQIAFFLAGSAFFMSTHVVLMLTERKFDFTASQLTLWLVVMPQLILALGSPLWGRIVDRFGIAESRVGVMASMVVYLICYFVGLYYGVPWLICVGGVIEGIARGGGQLTWTLAAPHYAPTADDVPLYNGVHFVLNGIRGLLLPWVGLLLFVQFGSWTVFLALLLTLASIPVLFRTIQLGRERFVSPSRI